MSTQNTVAKALIAKALASGFCISVNDGEEWVVKKSIDADQIFKALWSTDEDRLRIRDVETGVVVGDILLVWGNAEDGSELIADYSDNPAMATLMFGVG